MRTFLSQFRSVPRFCAEIQKRQISNLRPFSRNAIFSNCSKYRKQEYFLLQKYSVVHTIKVPNMGDSISEGTLVEWTKKIGDYCNVDDVVAVIETDKVTIDIRTDHAGALVEQLAKVDDTLEVGALLFKIDTEAKGSSKDSTAQPKTQEPEKKKRKLTNSIKRTTASQIITTTTTTTPANTNKTINSTTNTSKNINSIFYPNYHIK